MPPPQALCSADATCVGIVFGVDHGTDGYVEHASCPASSHPPPAAGDSVGGCGVSHGGQYGFSPSASQCSYCFWACATYDHNSGNWPQHPSHGEYSEVEFMIPGPCGQHSWTTGSWPFQSNHVHDNIYRKYCKALACSASQAAGDCVLKSSADTSGCDGLSLHADVYLPASYPSPPPSSPPAVATSVQDPHLHLPHGGHTDFRGEDGAWFAFLSAPNVSVNVLTKRAVFELKKRGGEGKEGKAGSGLEVDGTFIH
ncbi:MAG: hypothetical protein GY911_05015 [Actinomycetales bacterium]|nr:hypothetical protein [Actinomycetales bacterium]